MILDAARLALANLLAPETRSVFWKVLGLTILALVALWFALRELFVWLALPWIDTLMPGTPVWAGWLTFIFGIFASLGLALALALLLAPVTALIAGFFLDDVAEVIETRDYPNEPKGRPLPLGEAIAGSAKFLGVVILGNLVALFLLLVPGVNLVAFFLVNGYLLGREYFDLVATRHLPAERATALRRAHGFRIVLAGAAGAFLFTLPLAALLAPLVATPAFVHLYKRTHP